MNGDDGPAKKKQRPDSDISENRFKFELLPNGIVENIFSRLPIGDLFLNVSRVCKQFKQVICADSFLPFRKRRRRYASLGGGEMTEMRQSVLREAAIGTSKDCLLDVARYMGLTKFMPKMSAHLHGAMTAAISRHTFYENACAILENELKMRPISPWSVMAVIVFLCEDVHQMKELLHLLTHESDLPYMQVMEGFHFIALMLKLCVDEFGVGHWLFYSVNYCLYVVENCVVPDLNQRRATVSIANSGKLYTPEQQKFLNYELLDNETCKIVAFTGTGKTSTLFEYAKLRPHKRFLYIVYNKSAQQDAKAKYNYENVTCLTSHSLAYRNTVKYWTKLEIGNLREKQIRDVLDRNGEGSLYERTQLAIVTLQKFIASADFEISQNHTPIYSPQARTESLKRSHGPLKDCQKQQAVIDSKCVWKHLSDKNDQRLTITHDFYLKLYQLSKPQIRGYDIIFIDEAQDCNMAFFDVIRRQTTAKIFVGDLHQQIYAFRGAVNVLDKLTNAITFYLTMSFRFGPEIAYVASTFLEKEKNEKKPLVGNLSDGCLYYDRMTQNYDDGEKDQLVVIARKNATLFDEARKMCESSNPPRTIAFIGGKYFEEIMDIYALHIGEDQRKIERREIQSKFLQTFSQYGDPLTELEDYCWSNPGNGELRSKIMIFHEQGSSVLKHIEKVQTGNIKSADVIFSTAHKSKGLEFDNVFLCDDFMQFKDSYEADCTDGSDGFFAEYMDEPRDLTEEEKNLLYVAATRAKKCLVMNKAIFRTLDDLDKELQGVQNLPDNEKCNLIWRVARFPENGKCLGCDKTIADSGNELGLTRPRISVGENEVPGAGFHCVVCLRRRLFAETVSMFLPILENSSSNTTSDEEN